MQIKLTNIKVYRSNFDVVIGYYINPINLEEAMLSLGVFKVGEQQEFFTANCIEVIDPAYGETNGNCAYGTTCEEAYEEYDRINSDD